MSVQAPAHRGMQRRTVQASKHRWKLVALAIAAVTAISGCAGTSGTSREAHPEIAVAPTDSLQAIDGEMAAVTLDSGQQSPSVIRTATINLESTDPRETADVIARIASDLGGRVDSRTVDTEPSAMTNRARYAGLVLRVPEPKLEEALEEIRGAGDVMNESLTDYDVTAEHVDLDARVSSLSASIDRLERLLIEADSVTDLLEIEGALAERQADLDALTARLASLEDQIEYATVNVNVELPGTLPTEGPQTFWEGLMVGLESIAKAASVTSIALGVLLPWLLITGVIVLLVIFIAAARKRRIKRQLSEQQPD